MSFTENRLPFKSENSLEKRKELSAKIKKQNSNRVPVIVERHISAKRLNDIPKRKFLVPEEITMGQFALELRKHIQLRPEETIFWMINNRSIPPSGELIGNIYEKNKDQDGFLYITYTEQNFFGS